MDLDPLRERKSLKVCSTKERSPESAVFIRGEQSGFVLVELFPVESTPAALEEGAV